jgi:glycosyltransferase involved in cell wall biosynthesis
MGKNIWLWNHYAIRMCEDKAGRHFWFAEQLVFHGNKATVFCANTYHGKYETIDTGSKKYTIKRANNIPFVFVKTKPGVGNGIARVMNMVLFYKNLFSVSKSYAKIDGRPDVIIASSVHPLTMIAGIKIAKKFDIPCICEVRDLWPEAIFAFGKVKENSLLGRLLVAGEHWIYKKANAIIFTKEGDTDYLKEKNWDIEKGGDVDLKKCHYINNGINLDYYLSAISENMIDDHDLANEKFKVIYAGTIRPVNNLGNLLDAAGLLKQYSDIQFLIYGQGEQTESLKKRVIDEELTNVKFKGFIQRRYIPYVLSKSSVNILNYSQSKFNWTRGNSSNKLFEYMSSGKPIISTIKMGYSIIEKYNCGIELVNSTPEELAKAVLYFKNMPKNEYNQIALNAKNGAKDYDVRVLAKKLIDVINSVEKGRNIIG